MVTVRFLNHNASRGIRQKVPRWAGCVEEESILQYRGGLGLEETDKGGVDRDGNHGYERFTGKILECKENTFKEKERCYKL